MTSSASAALQCLEREGWLVPPLVNGCRAAALSRACKQDLEGWLGRQECFKLEQVFSDKKAARQLQWLAHRCPQLRYLELGIVIGITGRTYVLDEAIQAVAWGCSLLRHIDLSGNTIADETIEVLAQACPQLECLYLSFCDLTDEALWAVEESCPQMQEIDVSRNSFSPWAVQAFAFSCAQLKLLNVSHCTDLSNAIVQSIARGCSQMRALILNTDNRGDVVSSKAITDVAMISIAEKCPQLESLEIFGLQFLTDASIEALANGCQSLKNLDVSRCTGLTNAALQSLAQGCTQLESLTARHCRLLTSEVIQVVVKGCPRLTHLDVTPLAYVRKSRNGTIEFYDYLW